MGLFQGGFFLLGLGCICFLVGTFF
jgi:hypothetical protein